MEEDKDKAAIQFVAQFRFKFKEKFGVTPKITYDLQETPKIPLQIIEGAANDILNTLCSYFYQSGITTIYHDKNVLLCRWVYYKVCIELGYSKTKAASYIRQQSASVGYGYGRITKLIKDNDEEATRVYNEIKNKITEAITGNTKTV